MPLSKSAQIEEMLFQLLDQETEVRTQDISTQFKGSEPLVAFVFSKLLKKKKLLKVGSTRGAYYILNTPQNRQSLEKKVTRLRKTYKNQDLEEHVLFEEFKAGLPRLHVLHENIQSIVFYAFTEMVNNAIEHSKSDRISILMELVDTTLRFEVKDYGIGVFRNVKNKKGLADEYEAAAELTKGKMTTAPKLHSGEGIFFTSKAADLFVLESYGMALKADNLIPDIFILESGAAQGTKVTFEIALNSKRHLARDVFGPFTTDPDELAFDKTEIKVRLYQHGTAHMSRSQARRIVTGLEKFKTVILDFDQIPYIGQAFADEVFRVFKHRFPDIVVQTENANRAVTVMIKRVSA